MSDRMSKAGRLLLSVVSAACVGVFLSSITACICLLMAGAGHGPNSPSFVHYGPLFAWVHRMPNTTDDSFQYYRQAIRAMFVFYSVYCVAISVGRFFGRGKLVLAILLCLHYWCVGLCWLSDDWDGIRSLWAISGIYGPWITVVMVELFVVLQLLAYQYASSEIPFRPTVTRQGQVLLVLGVVAGVALQLAAVLLQP